MVTNNHVARSTHGPGEAQSLRAAWGNIISGRTVALITGLFGRHAARQRRPRGTCTIWAVNLRVCTGKRYYLVTNNHIVRSPHRPRPRLYGKWHYLGTTNHIVWSPRGARRHSRGGQPGERDRARRGGGGAAGPDQVNRSVCMGECNIFVTNNQIARSPLRPRVHVAQAA